LVLSIYRSTSIPSFSRFLEAIKLHNMGFGHSMNHEELMEYASKFYEDAILEGTWDRSTSSSFNARKGDQKGHSVYQPPSDHEKEVKEIFGVIHKFCKICRRWTYGVKAHVTADHVVREKTDGPKESPVAPSPANTESPRLPRNSEFRRVNFSGGL
jgi:hypothetical protein